MLFYLLTFPFIASAIFAWGLITLRLIGGAGVLNISDYKRIDDVLFACGWLGISVVGGLTTLVSLFLPVTLPVTLSVLVFPVLSLCIPGCRQWVTELLVRILEPEKRRAVLILIIGLLVLPIAVFGSQLIVYFDTAFYHLPMARIIETYGAVKGMVQIHLNFGQVSSWLSLSAAGTGGGESSWGAQSANVYLAMFAATQTTLALRHVAIDSVNLSDAIAAIGFSLVLLLATRWGMIASLSPDLPAMLIVVAVAWLLSLKHSRLALAVALPVAAFAVTVKLSTAPLAVVAGAAALRLIIQDRRMLIWGGVIATIVFGVFAVMSVLANGCVGFPAAITCFDLPWTPPDEKLTRHSSLIIDAARGGGRVLPSGTSTIDGFLSWASRDTSGAIVVGVGLFTAVLLGGMRLISGRPQNAALWPLVLSTIGIVYVAVLAPSGRFGGGYTAVLLAVLACTIVRSKKQNFSFARFPILPVGIAASLVLIQLTSPSHNTRSTIAERVEEGVFPSPGYGIVTPQRIIAFNITQPEARRTSPWKAESKGEMKATRPTNGNECWDAPPPCFPRGILTDYFFDDFRSRISTGPIINSQQSH